MFVQVLLCVAVCAGLAVARLYVSDAALATTLVAIAAVAAAILLAVVFVQARVAQDRIARLGDVHRRGGSSAFTTNKHGVHTYSVVVDVAATAAVASHMTPSDAAASIAHGLPPPQTDAALFACGSSGSETLIGTYSRAVWVALRPGGDGSSARLFQDIAAGRVRYLMISGTVVRAWVWLEKKTAGRGSWTSSNDDAFPPLLQPPPQQQQQQQTIGESMPGVQAGTVILIIADPISLVANADAVPSTSACKGVLPAPSVAPLRTPLPFASSWGNLVSSLTPGPTAAAPGTIAMHVWGFA